jgi:hypothetical protein
MLSAAAVQTPEQSLQPKQVRQRQPGNEVRILFEDLRAATVRQLILGSGPVTTRP